MKQSIVLIGMILFILLCSGVFAEDEEIYDLREEEDLVLILTYVGGYYYESCLLTKGNTEENIVTIRPIPKRAGDIKIYSYRGTEGIKTEYVKIENEEELRNFFDVYPAVNEYIFFEYLEKSLAHENILLGIIFPEDLNVDGEFKIEVLSKTKIDEWMGESYYGYDRIKIKFSGKSEDLNRFSFVLRNRYRFWYRDGGLLERTEENEEILSWKISENRIEYLHVTFGTPEERLHWENYVSDIENFIYIIIGLFLAIAIPIMLTRFEIRREYKWTKYCLLLLSFVVFLIFFNLRINYFKLEEIPLETCLSGECLVGKINSAFTWLSTLYLFLLSVSCLFIDRERRNRREN